MLGRTFGSHGHREVRRTNLRPVWTVLHVWHCAVRQWLNIVEMAVLSSAGAKRVLFIAITGQPEKHEPTAIRFNIS